MGYEVEIDEGSEEQARYGIRRAIECEEWVKRLGIGSNRNSEAATTLAGFGFRDERWLGQFVPRSGAGGGFVAPYENKQTRARSASENH